MNRNTASMFNTDFLYVERSRPIVVKVTQKIGILREERQGCEKDNNRAQNS